MVWPRLAVWGVIGLGLATGAASCQSTPVAADEELRQAVEELRTEVAVLKRTVARLEQELAEAKAAPARSGAPEPVKAAKKEEAATQCAGTTKAGARCKREARAGARFCWQHAGR